MTMLGASQEASNAKGVCEVGGTLILWVLHAMWWHRDSDSRRSFEASSRHSLDYDTSQYLENVNRAHACMVAE